MNSCFEMICKIHSYDLSSNVCPFPLAWRILETKINWDDIFSVPILLWFDKKTCHKMCNLFSYSVFHSETFISYTFFYFDVYAWILCSLYRFRSPCCIHIMLSEANTHILISVEKPHIGEWQNCFEDLSLYSIRLFILAVI